MKRRGFTLLECILVGALTTTLVGMGLKLFVTAQQLQALSTLAHERLEQTRELGTAIRESIREASGREDGAGEYVAGEACLVLSLPSEAHQRRTVIGVASENRQPFIATMRLEGEAWMPERFQSFTLRLSSLRFTHEDGNLVQCQYALAPEEGERPFGKGAAHVVWAQMRAAGAPAP